MLLPHLSIQPSSVSGIDLQNSDREWSELWSKLRPRPFTLTVTGTAFSVSPGLLVAEGLLLVSTIALPVRETLLTPVKSTCNGCGSAAAFTTLR